MENRCCSACFDVAECELQNMAPVLDSPGAFPMYGGVWRFATSLAECEPVSK